MIVVMFCCHVRRYMNACHVMLQNGCMPVAWGLLWRGSRSIHARLSGDAA